MRFLKTVPSKLVLLAVSWSLNQDSSWASHAGFTVKATLLDEIVFSSQTMKKKRDLNLVLISRSEFLTTLTPCLTFHGTHQWNTTALKSKTAVWDRCLWSCLCLWVFLSDKCMFIILSRLSPWKMAEKCHALLPQVDFHKSAQTFLLCIWETWVEKRLSSSSSKMQHEKRACIQHCSAWSAQKVLGFCKEQWFLTCHQCTLREGNQGTYPVQITPKS